LPRTRLKPGHDQPTVHHNHLAGAEREIGAREGGDRLAHVLGVAPSAFAKATADKARLQAGNNQAAINHDDLPR
jgi:hypothetical protein